MKDLKSNVILADYEVSDDWDYKKAIEKNTGEKWEVKTFVTNRLHGNPLKVAFRYICYFAYSFKIFLKRNNYKNIIAWQQFYGLILAFFCKLFRCKQVPNIYIMTFIYKPKKIGLYNNFIRYIICSGYIKKLIVLSESEKQYYSSIFGVPSSLFHCTRIGVPDVSEKFQNRSEGKYFLSAGRSNRDYSFLRTVWKKEYGDLIIVCDSYKEEKKEGITCLNNCFGDEYLSLVANCFAQIIPLDDKNIASGSLSFLQAMMLSKPTIVTENTTVGDYITDKEDGLIINKNASDLEKALMFLADENNYINMCQCARKTYVSKFSEYSLGVDIGELVRRTASM